MKNKNVEINKIQEYDFDIIEIIKVGFRRIEGVKLTFIKAFLIYTLITIIVQVVFSIFFPSPPPPAEPNYVNQMIVALLSYPILMPLIAGIIMMAVKYSRSEELALNTLFSYYPLAGKLSLAGIFIYIVTLIGFLLLILPGIYLSIAYVFAIPLIVDKEMDIWDAMETSRKAVTKHWFKVFGLFILLSLIMALGALALGIGLIWAVPLLFVTLYGLLYPLIFDGVEF